MRILAAALAFALAACSQAADAPARDPALEALFEQLAQTDDAALAQRVEQQIWSKWAESGSPTVDILLERAAAAEAAGEASLAVDFLAQASELAPNFAEPWNRRASLAYNANDYRGAIEAIQETLRREPRHFGAMAGLGMIYEELGQDAAALEAYRSALAVHPNYESAKRGVARLEPKIEGQDA